MKIDRSNGISMGSEYAFGLNGSGKHSRQQLFGLIGHETAHRILQHHERGAASILAFHGIPVESLEAAGEFVDAGASNFKELPKTESGKRLVEAFLKFAEGKGDPNQVYRDMYQSAMKANPNLSRDQEKEADMLTLRDSYLARGLRDYFAQEVYEQEAKCAKKNLDCSSLYKDSDTHPSLPTRKGYMTRGLCGVYPKENQDLCGDLARGTIRNGTCPI